MIKQLSRCHVAKCLCCFRFMSCFGSLRLVFIWKLLWFDIGMFQSELHSRMFTTYSATLWQATVRHFKNAHFFSIFLQRRTLNGGHPTQILKWNHLQIENRTFNRNILCAKDFHTFCRSTDENKMQPINLSFVSFVCTK